MKTISRRRRALAITAGWLTLAAIVASCDYVPTAGNSPTWTYAGGAQPATVAVDWTNSGATYGCSTTSTTSGDNIVKTTTCSQDQYRTLSQVTSTDTYWLYQFRHSNEFWNGLWGAHYEACQTDYYGRVYNNEGIDGQVNTGNWVMTAGWQTTEQPNMHGCGGHGTKYVVVFNKSSPFDWRRHAEERRIYQYWRDNVSTWNEWRTVPTSSSVTVPKPSAVPT